MTEENKRILAAAILDKYPEPVHGVVVTHHEVYVLLDEETAVRYLHNYGDVDLSAAALAPIHVVLTPPTEVA